LRQHSQSGRDDPVEQRGGGTMGGQARRRWLAIMAAALVVGACESSPPITISPAGPTAATTPVATAAPSAAASPSATAAPTATPTAAPTPTPSASTAAGRWPYRAPDSIVGTLFHDDGSVVLVERDFIADRSSVMTLDAAGQPLAGWPWSPEGSSFAIAALGPSGSIYVVTRGPGSTDIEFAWTLHRLSREAKEAPGFPVHLPDASFCDLQASPVGSAYITCEISDDSGAVTKTTVNAIEPDGSTAFAAPVTFPREASLIGFGTDDLPVLSIPGAKRTVVRKLSSDGTTRWSTSSTAGEAELDTAGRVRLTDQEFGPDACGTPLRTTYDVLNPDGTRPAGWPVTVTGWASRPVALQDGSSVVVTASGRAVRYTLHGSVVAGWPVRGIDVSFDCFDGTTPASDGQRVVVVGVQQVTVLQPGGRIPAGWPANPPGRNAEACPGCTPGSGAMLNPVLGEGPVTYVATYGANDRPRVALIDAAGRIENQVALGAAGAQIGSLAAGPTGRVWAVTQQATSDSELDTLWLVADPPAAP
jgi:hypothetical protein